MDGYQFSKFHENMTGMNYKVLRVDYLVHRIKNSRQPANKLGDTADSLVAGGAVETPDV